MAKLLSEVSHNVATEPSLQPVSGETFTHRSANVSAEARLDIKARVRVCVRVFVRECVCA